MKNGLRFLGLKWIRAIKPLKKERSGLMLKNYAFSYVLRVAGRGEGS